MSEKNLDELRDELLAVDREILEAVAKRLAVVSEIGKAKRRQQLPVRSFTREKKVMAHAMEQAKRLGVPQALATSVLDSLVKHALEIQERDRVEEARGGTGKSALVIGGCGKIGAWFARFLLSSGYDVRIADPGVCHVSAKTMTDWQSDALDEDIIVVATPLGMSGDILSALAARRPKGTVFDVASLKGPVKEGLAALLAAGCRVTSVHPMFGPDTTMLSGRHVIFMDVGHSEAHQQTRALFKDTMATCVDMTLDEHDELIAYVLGLSHLLNIAFFTALGNSGEQAERLRSMSSTSFDAQLKVAHKIAEENPHLYFEIQRLNEYRHGPQQALLRSVREIIEIVESNREADFVEVMSAGKAYLQTLQSVSER
ncbi:MAG: prephenate dehydrogenase/arogenate dehydrogenase family protein [Deltaproteobacteria bacterium]|nr:prephenate dehydrogenase/arogenate dehydrogenase family protein [Deltaproteobacteria bacterium]